MKKLILAAAIILGINFASGQKLKDADVPAAVKASFTKAYPAIKKIVWEKEEANFEAEFKQNKVETTAVFDASGTLLETESKISAKDLPKDVTEYLAKNVPGKKIEEAAKIADAKGVITFEAEVAGFDYLFDSKGVFIKKTAVVPEKD